MNNFYIIEFRSANMVRVVNLVLFLCFIRNALSRNFEKSVGNIEFSVPVGKTDMCSDFYTYVCKGYRDNGEQTLDRESLLNFHFYGGNHLSDAEIKARDFYESCQEQRSGKQLKGTTFYKKFGGWPVLESFWEPSPFNWTKGVQIFKDNGILLFVVIDVEEKNGKKVLKVFPNLGHLIQSVDSWRKGAYRTMMAFGASERAANETLEEIFSFALRLHSIVHDALFGKGEETVQVPYEVFKGFYNEIKDWDQYLGKTAGIILNDGEKVHVRGKSTLKKLLKLLDSTSSKVIANYMWIDALRGANTNCGGLIERYFQFLYSNLEDRSVYIEENVLDLLQNIQRTLDKFSKQNPVDSSAQIRLNLLKNYVIFRDPDIDTEYESLQIDRNNFIQNYFNVLKYYSKKARITGEDTVPSQEMWNFYNSLRHPSYSDLFPLAMNLGRFGQTALVNVLRNFGSTYKAEEVKDCLLKQSAQWDTDLIEDDEYVNSPLHWVIVSQAATKLALETFRDLLKVGRSDSSLRQFETEQVFFGSYVSQKCSKKSLKDFVNASLRNLEEFSLAFKCPIGSDMNPKKKCKIF